VKGKTVLNLTPVKIEMLQVFYHYQQNKPYSPTMRELAEVSGKSRATVFEHCVALQESGFLCASREKVRSLKLTEQAIELLEEIESSDRRQEQPVQYLDGGIPLVGMINAGLPSEAIENCERISFESEFAASSGNTFALEVSGESMINDNICPGDYVVCKKCDNPKNGDIVVAIVDETEATLKRFYKEKNHIRLQPANDSFMPIITRNCQIRGVVVGLVRKFN